MTLAVSPAAPAGNGVGGVVDVSAIGPLPRGFVEGFACRSFGADVQVLDGGGGSTDIYVYGFEDIV